MRYLICLLLISCGSGVENSVVEGTCDVMQEAGLGDLVQCCGDGICSSDDTCFITPEVATTQGGTSADGASSGTSWCAPQGFQDCYWPDAGLVMGCPISVDGIQVFCGLAPDSCWDAG